MSIKGKAYIAGIYEHPTRLAKDISLAQIHAQCAKGALEDAGLTKDDVDGYFCAGDAPGFGGMSMVDYMGLRNVRHLDSTETGGSSYILHVGHAVQAIAAGKCQVALITLAGRPRTEGASGVGVGQRLHCSHNLTRARCAAAPSAPVVVARPLLVPAQRADGSVPVCAVGARRAHQQTPSHAV